MDIVKEKLNSMKAQSELSEERIIRFESALRQSKQQLEAALKEKESLCRKIEAVESQVINADQQRAEIADRLKGIEHDTDTSECRRKVLENREVEGDEELSKLEGRLRIVQDKYSENSVRCEEGERRFAVLTAEYDRLHARRVQKEERASSLEKQIDSDVLKLRRYEDVETKLSDAEFQFSDHMKLLESYHREADERKDLGRMNILRLRRLIEQTQDDIETVQMKTKATKVEMQNTVQAVINN